MSTITREFTKEQLQQIIETDHVQCGEASSLARIALASLEAVPVCVIDQSNLDYLKSGSDADVWPASRAEMGDVLLYRAAPPAPVSVPAAMEMDDDFDSAFEHGKAVGWNACRAAMLQGADVSLTHEGKNHHEDKLGMVNHLGDVTEKVEPVTQIEPVADLYGLTSPTGGETSFTFDAVEARDFIDGGWSCQEYVELGRYQEALTDHSEDKLAMVDHSGDSNNMVEPVTTAGKLPFDQWLSQQTGTIDVECGCVMTEVFFHWLRVAYEAGKSPVIPDGWVACSERMPEEGSKVIVFRPRASESNDPPVKTATYKGGREYYHGFDCYCEPTHWMPLPAAPHQEVIQALAKGMERYGDAMQELAKKEVK